jgi:hypothetical protein
MLLASVLSVARGASAEQVDARAAARLHFQSGVDAVSRGDLARAVTDFDAAYALSPEPVVLYNLGLTHSALGHPVEAVKALELYLGSHPPPAPGERTDEARALLRTNQRRIGTLALEVEPAAAAIEVDGVQVELTAGKVLLATGPHAVVARVPGRVPGVLNVTVAPEKETRARLVLPGTPSGSAPRRQGGSDASRRKRAMPPPSQRRAPTVPLPAVLSGGLGLAALGAGAAFAITAHDLERTAEARGHCNDRDCDEIGLPLREEAGKRANVATALLAAGGALVGAGVALFFVLDRGESPSSGVLSALVARTADGRVGTILAFRFRN